MLSHHKTKYIEQMNFCSKAKRNCLYRSIALSLGFSVLFFSYAAVFVFGAYLLTINDLNTGDFFK